jgi:hypothetical protein
MHHSSMKRITLAAMLAIACSLVGCKPDAAVERGAVVGSGPQTPGADANKPGTPIVTKPKIVKEAPVKQVQ